MSIRSAGSAFLHRNLREDEFGKAGIALSLAMLTVIAAIVAGLQGNASVNAQQGKREADRISLEAIGRDTSAVIQIGTASGVYRRWFEQAERADWAQSQQTIAVDASNRPQLDALNQAELDIEAWTRTQSDVFNPPYTVGGGDPNFAAYDADKYVHDQVLADQQRSVEAEVASAWDGKASDYVTILTILAVGLFFLGLASTVGRRARPLLASAGVLFGVGAAVWALAIAVGPVHRVPESAVEHVVDARVDWAKTPDDEGASAISSAARTGYQSSIDAATAAIADDPAYTYAYDTRADVRTDFADHLFFASGPSAEVTTILTGAIDDYHRYLAVHPEDYAAWWNLGWSLYLVGNQPASVDATNQALVHSPAQFTLYLNRAIAFLAGGDQKQALADVDEAIQRAAQDSTDSSQYYLGQSDFDIGRLAQIHPEQADILRGIQVRLREAQVSLRVFGNVRAAADAPQLGPVTVMPVQLKQYQGGTLVAGAALANGSSFTSTDAVGVRVSVPQAAALLGRTVSARIWLNGLPASEYDTDVAVKNFPVTIDLVSPYGRAGFDLTPGAYQLDLYVDGARRSTLSWTVKPPPDQPVYQLDATQLLAALDGLGFGCDAPTTTDGASSTNCSVLDNDQTTYIADLTWDVQDRITYLVLAATTPDGSTNDVNALGHTFFGYVVGLLYPADVAKSAATWIDSENSAVDDYAIGGTRLRVYGNTDHARTMDITSPWP